MSDNKHNPATESELNDMIMKAVQDNDHNEIDRLMAVEVEEEVQNEELPEEEKPVEKEDGTSDAEEVEKEEAAPDVKEPAASTPEPVKAEENETELLRRELHKLKSDAGRVPHMQSRMKELERELREVKLSRSVGATDPTDPEKIKAVEVPANLKKKIEDLRDVDPALADLLEDMTKALRSETQETAGRLVSTITETEREYDEQRVVEDQYTQLVSNVPWAPQAFKSQEWKQWKDSLTPGRRAMAESMYADDVKIALNAFAQDMQARQGNATSVTQVPTPTVVDEEAERIKQNRERKLSTSTSVKGATAKASAPPLDEEALFREAFERTQKENHLI